jgi:hypothetical protein
MADGKRVLAKASLIVLLTAFVVGVVGWFHGRAMDRPDADIQTTLALAQLGAVVGIGLAVLAGTWRPREP